MGTGITLNKTFAYFKIPIRELKGLVWKRFHYSLQYYTKNISSINCINYLLKFFSCQQYFLTTNTTQLQRSTENGINTFFYKTESKFQPEMRWNSQLAIATNNSLCKLTLILVQSKKFLKRWIHWNRLDILNNYAKQNAFCFVNLKICKKICFAFDRGSIVWTSIVDDKQCNSRQ